MASPGKKAYPLRVDPALWEALERLAASELRSINGQIEFLLRDALARRGITVAPAARRRQRSDSHDTEADEDAGSQADTASPKN
ncbi:hypothetical protein [Chitinimonas sp.]|uniref:hypothetical protein n=1 Tax=Chitinimonas sp. TaxID=1934313 RepID=UPI0035B11758